MTNLVENPILNNQRLRELLEQERKQNKILRAQIDLMLTILKRKNGNDERYNQKVQLHHCKEGQTIYHNGELYKVGKGFVCGWNSRLVELRNENKQISLIGSTIVFQERKGGNQ